MAGIYIHIPFCKTICSYCDFYSRTNLNYIDDFVNSIIKEINLRHYYLGNTSVKTVYFGGGTPSLLNSEQINKIFRKLSEIFKFSEDLEFTFEVNPDDLAKEYIMNLRNTPVNRVSIGVQSFIEKELKLLNRRHNAKTSLNAIENLLTAGFDNLSCDLIYGIPGSNLDSLDYNLRKIYEFEIKHISAYHLSYEKNTPITKLLKNKKIIRIGDIESNRIYKYLIDNFSSKGFRQYEISNFAKKGFISKHNSSYWKNIKYIGLGPSAHSYNLRSRQWNISNIKKYISSLYNGILPSNIEVINKEIAFNEFVMTRLRTKWGIKIEQALKYFSYDMVEILEIKLKDFARKKLVIEKERSYKLSFRGKLIADKIIKDLFI
jgi:oxygen-independent coproporphyrinogen III oxidase